MWHNATVPLHSPVVIPLCSLPAGRQHMATNRQRGWPPIKGTTLILLPATKRTTVP